MSDREKQQAGMVEPPSTPFICLDLDDDPEYSRPEIAKLSQAIRDSATRWASKVIHFGSLPDFDSLFKYIERR